MHVFLSHINVPGGDSGFDHEAVCHGWPKASSSLVLHYLFSWSHVEEDEIHIPRSGMEKWRRSMLS